MGNKKFDFPILTFCAWINIREFPVNDIDMRIVTSGSENENLWLLDIARQSRGRKIVFSNTNANHATRASNAVPDLNTWYHVCGIRTPGEALYVNGVEQTSTAGDSWGYTANSKIGSRGGGQYFNGAIDDIRIYIRQIELT